MNSIKSNSFVAIELQFRRRMSSTKFGICKVWICRWKNHSNQQKVRTEGNFKTLLVKIEIESVLRNYLSFPCKLLFPEINLFFYSYSSIRDSKFSFSLLKHLNLKVERNNFIFLSLFLNTFQIVWQCIKNQIKKVSGFLLELSVKNIFAHMTILQSMAYNWNGTNYISH